MLSEAVKVEREKVAACITCPLCNKLFREATTISECLHSFCKKCIYKKINDEELDYCPVCNINLGCSPLEKLRPDHSLEGLRTKLFSSKRKKVKPVALPAVPSPVRRKEISLSSLVSRPPKVVAAAQFVQRSSKRLKAIARTHPALRDSVAIDMRKPDELTSSSPAILSEISQNSDPDLSKQQKMNKDSDIVIPCKVELELCEHFSCLLEDSEMQGSDPADKEVRVAKSTVKEQISEPKVNGDANNWAQLLSCSVKARKLQSLQRKSAAVPEGLNAALPIVGPSSKCDGRFNPIWFSLIASDDQDGDSPLPQISSCYLRVKDGSLRVSTIKKYLAQKLGLANEIEVEIRLLGQPIGSMIQLHELVEWWLHIMPALTERMQTRVGSSAKDFVMVLSYTRKSKSPSP